MNEQLDLFSFNTPSYKITKPIRLIEFFAGIGSQAKALKRLGIPFEHHKICEWAIPSIISYNAIHIQNFENERFKGYTKAEMVEWLLDKGVSINYNEPALKSQLERMNEDKLRMLCVCVWNTNDLVDISRVHAEDLEITETDKYDYILTYSYPCQDLSMAGKRAGQKENSGTRSSLLWEVGRILKELKAINALPKILLLENVPQCHSGNNIQEWRRWNTLLQELGYSNYAEDLNSKDYGIPQNRNRCFMISILGDYHYTFPKKHKLKLKLKDMLEPNVDEKYFLSDKMIRYISYTGTGNFNNTDSRINLDIARPLTTEQSKRAGTTNYISEELESNYDLRLLIKENTTRSDSKMDDNFIIIPEATEKGYAEAFAGDGIYINRPHQKRGVVQKGMIPTIKTSCDDIGVVVKTKNKRLLSLLENTEFIGNETLYLDAYNQKVNENVGTITTGIDFRNESFIYHNLRIRKLTPKECWRLMGFDDSDFEKAKEYQSDSMLYHQAGDSIVVNVLENIFKQLL